jgi:hypothetical protein
MGRPVVVEMKGMQPMGGFCVELAQRRFAMAQVTYDIVEHDGGYAYKVGEVFSETFPTHAAAIAAANSAAKRQQMAGQDAAIQYQDSKGDWHEEQAHANDRPTTDVEDDI